MSDPNKKGAVMKSRTKKDRRTTDRDATPRRRIERIEKWEKAARQVCRFELLPATTRRKVMPHRTVTAATEEKFRLILGIAAQFAQADLDDGNGAPRLLEVERAALYECKTEKEVETVRANQRDLANTYVYAATALYDAAVASVGGV